MTILNIRVFRCQNTHFGSRRLIFINSTIIQENIFGLREIRLCKPCSRKYD